MRQVLRTRTQKSQNGNREIDDPAWAAESSGESADGEQGRSHVPGVPATDIVDCSVVAGVEVLNLEPVVQLLIPDHE